MSFDQVYHYSLLSHRKVLQDLVLVGSPSQKLESLFSQALILDLVPPSQSLLHGPQSDQGDQAAREGMWIVNIERNKKVKIVCSKTVSDDIDNILSSS